MEQPLPLLTKRSSHLQATGSISVHTSCPNPPAHTHTRHINVSGPNCCHPHTWTGSSNEAVSNDSAFNLSYASIMQHIAAVCAAASFFLTQHLVRLYFGASGFCLSKAEGPTDQLTATTGFSRGKILLWDDSSPTKRRSLCRN